MINYGFAGFLTRGRRPAWRDQFVEQCGRITNEVEREGKARTVGSHVTVRGHPSPHAWWLRRSTHAWPHFTVPHTRYAWLQTFRHGDRLTEKHFNICQSEVARWNKTRYSTLYLGHLKKWKTSTKRVTYWIYLYYPKCKVSNYIKIWTLPSHYYDTILQLIC